MKIIYDPISKWFGHAKPNVGLLASLRALYPQEEILFVADDRHISGLKFYIDREKLLVGTVHYRHLEVENSFNPVGFLKCYANFKRLLKEAEANGCNEIFVLYLDGALIRILKRLKSSGFKGIKIIGIMHGNLEEISGTTYPSPVLPDETRPLPLLLSLARAGVQSYRKTKEKYVRMYDSLLKDYFQLKNEIIDNPCKKDFHYIVLAPFIIESVRSYLDPDENNFHGMHMPFTFLPLKPRPKNDFPKFATFGFGDNANLKIIAERLQNKGLKNKYEIRVIGMDNRGLQGLSNVTMLGSGKLLSREVMEDAAKDVDFFLILYNPYRYRFGCSTSVMESLSFAKPVVHLRSDMMAYFNRPESPIGLVGDNLEQLADAMAEIIEGFQNFDQTLSIFYNNIVSLRRSLEMSNADELKKIILKVHS